MYNFSVGMFMVIGVTILFLGVIAAMWLHGSDNLKNMSMEKYVGMHLLRVLIIFVVVLVGLLCFIAGKGSVIDNPLPYSQQLSTGELYTLLAGVKDGKTRVLLVRNGKNNFRAIRVVGTVPPPHFRLVDGKPVSVAVTTATGK